ncbi:unnamed protein product [Amoebophrya sp. A120]|nr:unnamed protein product [Amoebophrya sp. A120]|eukprot:GSA120T00023432001.1
MADIPLEGIADEQKVYLRNAVGSALTNALVVVAKERYLQSQLGATASETSLRVMAAHLRANNPERSDIYRAKKKDEYDEFVQSCTLRKRLAELIARRQDLKQSWKADDEKEYVKLCKQFDSLNKNK